MKINIASDFTDAPGGRHIQDGALSGEEFRQKYLEPALKKKGEEIIINLDGTFGYPTSFLEEAFGGLSRLEVYTVSELKKRLKFISTEDQSLPRRIFAYIEAGNA